MKYRNNNSVLVYAVNAIIFNALAGFVLALSILHQSDYIFSITFFSIVVVSTVIFMPFACAAIIVDERGVRKNFLLWSWKKWGWEEVVEIGVINPYLIQMPRFGNIKLPAHIYFSNKDNSR